MNLMKKSIEVIKKLQLNNGGILATPLNGAYPYIYVRDAVIMTKAMNRTGNIRNSERLYYFLAKNTKLDQYKEIFHRYNKLGMPYVTRKEQHDNVGLLLHGIYDTFLFNEDEEFLRNMWELINKSCKLVFNYSKNRLVHTETSIHELYRLEMGYELWTNCACCRGLYDAAEIARILKQKKLAEKWKKRAEEIHKNIKKKMFNKRTGLFMKNLKHPRVSDISQMSPFYFNLIDDKRTLRKTLNHLREQLWYKEAGGFRRFKKFEICKDWHWYTGGSGGWTAFTLGIARLHKRLGDRKNYNLCMNWVEKTARISSGLLPEHVSTKEEYELWKMNETEFNNRILGGMKQTERLNKKFRKKGEDIVYWAVPLGWAHAEYILTKSR